MRCAGWPGASARGAPAPAAPDRRRVGRRPGFGGARLVRGVGTRRVRSRRPLSISRLPTASAQTTGSRRNISRSGRVGPANNSARHPRRGPARACVRPRRPAPSPRGPRSRAGSYLWPVREPRRTGGRCPATAAPGRAPVPGGRAPLRGAASYEAERGCGARGGGTGRVGPPPGWRRLRLLRQIGDQLVPGVEQFLLVDDVVAVEDGTALVPGQEHGDPFGDVRADQVPRGGAAAIVEEAGRHPGRLAGGAPRRAPAADGDAVAVEDERAVGVAACPPARQRLGNGGRDGEDASHQRLRAPWREPDDAAGFYRSPPKLRPRISCLRQPE